LIVLTIVSAGRVANASKRETTKRAMKACNLRLEVRITIAIILIMTNMEIKRIFIAGKNTNIYKDSFLKGKNNPVIEI
jgi:predicted nuclease with TOPRIM domain